MRIEDMSIDPLLELSDNDRPGRDPHLAPIRRAG